MAKQQSTSCLSLTLGRLLDRQPHLSPRERVRQHGARGGIVDEVTVVGNWLYRLAGAGACLIAMGVGCCHCRGNTSSQPTPTNRGKVRITWSVESAQALYGFNIYRGPSAQGPWALVNPTPILAAEGGTTNIPHDYQYTDSDASIVLGQPCWYWLEAMDHDGTKRRVKWPPEQVIPKVRLDEEFPPLEKR